MFDKYFQQNLQIEAQTTIHADDMLQHYVPHRHDLHQRLLLFDIKQRDTAASFLQSIRDHVLEADYEANVPRETLVCDMFIHV